MRTVVALAMLTVLTACGSSSMSSGRPTSSLLRVTDLPAGWIVDRSLLVSSLPPCVNAAQSPFRGLASTEAAFAGEEHDLASLVERVVVLPHDNRTARFSEVVHDYAACNDTSWVNGGTKLELFIGTRTGTSPPGADLAGFTTILNSPAINVEPNPYVGEVDFVLVGDKFIELSMEFAGIPVDLQTFDSLALTAISRTKRAV